jgi:CheY-like chemotaxis protein
MSRAPRQRRKTGWPHRQRRRRQLTIRASWPIGGVSLSWRGGRVGHELHTLLAATVDCLGVLVDGGEGDPPPPAARFIRMAYDRSQRLQRLVKALFHGEKSRSDQAPPVTSNLVSTATTTHAAVPTLQTANRLPRILHLDDDHDVLDVVAATLRAYAEIVSASSIDEARRLLADTTIDLAVIDLSLAADGALDLVSELRTSTRKSVPIVVLSGADVDPDVAADVDAVLVKSQGSLEQLVDILRRTASLHACRGLNRTACASCAGAEQEVA